MKNWAAILKETLEISIRDCAWCGIWDQCLSLQGKICPCKQCIVKSTCASTCKPYEKYYTLINNERQMVD